MNTIEDRDIREQFSAGQDAGALWVRENARPLQLRRLEQNTESGTLFETGDPFGSAERICIAINGGFADRGELVAYWADVLGDDAERIRDENYARGFVCGALETVDAARQSAVR